MHKRWIGSTMRLVLLFVFLIITGHTPALAYGDGPSLLYAPSASDDPAFRRDVGNLLGGTVDYFNASTSTPTLSKLQQYDAVLTWPETAYADKVAMGDVLADYVDGGGRVILSVFSTFTSGEALGGRIMNSGYAPVYSPSGTTHNTPSVYAGNGTTFLHTGVLTYACSVRDKLAVQGAGKVDSTYQDGEIAVAYRPDFGVVYLNGLGVTNIGGTGDWARLVGNAVPTPATLEVVKAVNDSAPLAGQRITYTISIHNKGQSDATHALVSDTLSAGLLFAGPPVRLLPSQPSAILATSALSLPTLAHNITVAAGSQVMLSFPVTVSADLELGTVLTNTVAVTSSETPQAVLGMARAIVGIHTVYLPTVMKTVDGRQ